MASTTAIDVAALRALLAKATPGKWEATGRAIDRADAPFTEIAVDRCDADWCGNSSGIERSDDAALIAAAVNALPALLDAVEGAGGLVFGPPGARWERALSPGFDAIYTIGASSHGDGRWAWGCESLSEAAAWEVSCIVVDTRDAAIESARAHDRARRAGR